MWRRIRLLHVNVALYVLIVVLVGLFWKELHWARAELPEYLDNDIGGPAERTLYRDAIKILEKKRYIDDAEPLLLRSIAIDPHGEAVYWLGEYYLAKGRDDDALRELERYIEIDPTIVSAYLKISAIHEKRSDYEQALEVLRRGLGTFERYADWFRPHLDDRVAAKFNDKAVRVHERYRASVVTLELELSRLQRKAAVE